MPPAVWRGLYFGPGNFTETLERVEGRIWIFFKSAGSAGSAELLSRCDLVKSTEYPYDAFHQTNCAKDRDYVSYFCDLQVPEIRFTEDAQLGSIKPTG